MAGEHCGMCIWPSDIGFPEYDYQGHPAYINPECEVHCWDDWREVRSEEAEYREPDDSNQPVPVFESL